MIVNGLIILSSFFAKMNNSVNQHYKRHLSAHVCFPHLIFHF